VTQLTEPVGLAAVEAWMDRQSLGAGPITDAATMTGGTQNIMVRFRRAGRSYVLRRGPRHLRPRSNDVMLREVRLLRALAGTAVPHAPLVASCESGDVLDGAVFYLMDPVDGVNAGETVPEPARGSAAVRHAMGLSLVDALARLAGVDYQAAGLDGFGRPDGFLQRQVPRWLSELKGYSSLEGYPGFSVRSVEAVARWLMTNQPANFEPGVIHGDYHFANVIFDRVEPQVRAIVDWEMATVGDPLMDLGALLAIWPASDGEPDLLDSALSRLGGLPSEAELTARYAGQSARDLSGIDWYVVAACFKLGIVLEGTHARAFAGLADKETGDRLHRMTTALFARAEQRIA
jgi:aminoglycoside phosphotransferase (APT) family kinase protein